MMYGPYTPQECENVVSWLKDQNIKFEVLKDEDKEKEFRRSDGQNLVNQAHWRTEVFLAQVFYIQILQWSSEQESAFSQKFIQKQEVPPEFLRDRQNEAESDNKQLHLDAERSAKIKRYCARAIVIVWVGYMLYWIVKSIAAPE
ncbi:hypothetical protein [Pseudobdellovibrio exovorus]|uniref:Uncharacterized protein n=1 Tax=Pseudobdellovibrio exovorus JSS TaxID=1184267 RepID=M4V9A6_9BACT|nr:hypothetical protein [Pseudobdellovibrio exovorus]AGH94606.1 hypothetical protein A11Q_386 [Pseudobdellovibrio exovorus JSS]